MPQINEILDNRTKKFIKRSYRPWDLSGSLEIDNKNSNQTQTEHKLKNTLPKTTSNSINEVTASLDSNLNITQKTDTNNSQTEHKQNTIRLKKEHKVRTKSPTNRTQKTTLNRQNLEIEHKLGTESDTSKQKNHTQIASKLDTNVSFASLSGIQRDIVILIFNHCKLAKQDSTNEMSISYISSSLNIRIGSVKNSISRLEQKEFIIRLEYKIGRGGWSRYKISDALYSELLYLDKTHKLYTNNTQTTHKLDMEPNTEPDTASLSSSSLINITTTLTNEEKNEFPEEWKEIDIELLAELIRFHQGHVKQLFKHGLELKPVQESIYHYAFDLTENNKAKDIKTEPLSFFMGIMKRSGYYAAPENYESPQARGKRLFLEQEAIKAQKLLEAEKNLMNIHFEVWSNSLTHQDKIDLVGKDELGPNRAILTVIDKLKEYYKNNLWKEQYQKICGKEAYG
jgi:predicted transcriptional regulator